MLRLEPMETRFTTPTPGGFAFSYHKIINGSKDKLALKVKCSDNRVYRLRPVFSILEPNKDLTLTIARIPAPDKKDKLVIQAIHVTVDQNDPQVAWRGRTLPPDGQIALLLSAGPKTNPAAPNAPTSPSAASNPPPPANAPRLPGPTNPSTAASATPRPPNPAPAALNANTPTTAPAPKVP